ncbi:hypothetical protein J5N97_016944 [Dioscorea zingiberensis]|uniref:Uncharacterized protein n=1 Tax=Dioscorea zingiberensis TaxID=325984 RepID=A0A9D5CLC6_9LILI|nr:hypothetical protein J5N97_016944 [Dioscorea zingiberensis]
MPFSFVASPSISARTPSLPAPGHHLARLPPAVAPTSGELPRAHPHCLQERHQGPCAACGRDNAGTPLTNSPLRDAARGSPRRSTASASSFHHRRAPLQLCPPLFILQRAFLPLDLGSDRARVVV